MELRDYQKEAIAAIPESGRYLIQMATGLGKTVVISRIPRRGRLLILSHREELVTQPKKYFECSFGIEQASNYSNGEQVVSASVQSIVRRLARFKPHDFDIVVIDECHHSSATTYKKIIDYFSPRLLIGVTATPKRGDGAGLDAIFDEIIFERDLEWGIKNNYLSDIECIRANIGYDLSIIKTKLGDFDSQELEKIMNETVIIKAIADAYYKHAKGQTLIFVASVESCNLLQKEIPGSACIVGTTKNREDVLNSFKDGKIKCLINCMVLTEGTDLPCIETIIMARPTQSTVLYVQAVGRGTRLYDGKESLRLIDCVGVTGRHQLCTAPTLIGVDMDSVPASKKDVIEGNIFELPDKIKILSDVPESWIKNIEIVKLFAKRNNYELHNVNYFKCPDGSLICKLPERNWIKIAAVDKLGKTSITTQDGLIFKDIKAQTAFDRTFKKLLQDFKQYAYIWDLKICQRWGKESASEKQRHMIKKIRPDIETAQLTKLEASQILNRLFLR